MSWDAKCGFKKAVALRHNNQNIVFAARAPMPSDGEENPWTGITRRD